MCNTERQELGGRTLHEDIRGQSPILSVPLDWETFIIKTKCDIDEVVPGERREPKNIWNQCCTSTAS